MARFTWDKDEHPRGILGRFVKALGDASGGDQHTLQDKSARVTVEKGRDGHKRYVVADKNKTKAHANPTNAARDALSRSASNTGADSIGPGTNAYPATAEGDALHTAEKVHNETLRRPGTNREGGAPTPKGSTRSTPRGTPRNAEEAFMDRLKSKAKDDRAPRVTGAGRKGKARPKGEAPGSAPRSEPKSSGPAWSDKDEADLKRVRDQVARIESGKGTYNEYGTKDQILDQLRKLEEQKASGLGVSRKEMVDRERAERQAEANKPSDALLAAVKSGNMTPRQRRMAQALGLLGEAAPKPSGSAGGGWTSRPGGKKHDGPGGLKAVKQNTAAGGPRWKVYNRDETRVLAKGDNLKQVQAEAERVQASGGVPDFSKKPAPKPKPTNKDRSNLQMVRDTEAAIKGKRWDEALGIVDKLREAGRTSEAQRLEIMAKQGRARDKPAPKPKAEAGSGVVRIKMSAPQLDEAAGSDISNLKLAENDPERYGYHPSIAKAIDALPGRGGTVTLSHEAAEDWASYLEDIGNALRQGDRTEAARGAAFERSAESIRKAVKDAKAAPKPAPKPEPERRSTAAFPSGHQPGEGPATHTGWLGRYRKMKEADLVTELASARAHGDAFPKPRRSALLSALAEARGEKQKRTRGTKAPESNNKAYDADAMEAMDTGRTPAAAVSKLHEAGYTRTAITRFLNEHRGLLAGDARELHDKIVGTKGGSGGEAPTLKKVVAGHYVSEDGRWAIQSDGMSPGLIMDPRDLRSGMKPNAEHSMGVGGEWAVIFDKQGRMGTDPSAGENLDWYPTKKAAQEALERFAKQYKYKREGGGGGSGGGETSPPPTGRGPGLHVRRAGATQIHEVVDREGKVVAKRVSPTRYRYTRRKGDGSYSFHTKDPGGRGVFGEHPDSKKAEQSIKLEEQQAQRAAAMGSTKGYVSKADNPNLTVQERRDHVASELARLREELGKAKLQDDLPKQRVLNGDIHYAESDYSRLKGRHMDEQHRQEVSQGDAFKKLDQRLYAAHRPPRKGHVIEDVDGWRLVGLGNSKVSLIAPTGHAVGRQSMTIQQAIKTKQAIERMQGAAV